MLAFSSSRTPTRSSFAWLRALSSSGGSWRTRAARRSSRLVGSLDVGGIAGRREALDACGVAYEFVDAATVDDSLRFERSGEMPSRSFSQTAVSCTPIEREQPSSRLQRADGVLLVENTRRLTGSPSTPTRCSSRRRQVPSGHERRGGHGGRLGQSARQRDRANPECDAYPRNGGVLRSPAPPIPRRRSPNGSRTRDG